MGAAIQPWITALAGPILTIIVLAIWRYRDTTHDRINALDAKFDALKKFLTDNLIAINKEMGELKGASHRHVPNEQKSSQ